MLLSEAPSGEGLTRNVALPGFPAGFESPGTGLSTPAGVRSISTSALARVKGALSLIGSDPVSHEPKLRPRLARPAASRANVIVADPSSPGARATSTWVAAPSSSPSPAIFSTLRSASNEAVAESSFSSARNFSIWRLSSAPLAWNWVSSGRAVLPSLRARTRSPSACPLTVAGSRVRPAWRRNGSRIKRSASESAVPVMCALEEASTMGLGVISGTVKARSFACTRRDGERTTGEGSRSYIDHHDSKGGEKVDADVAGREFTVQAYARKDASMHHL